VTPVPLRRMRDASCTFFTGREYSGMSYPAFISDILHNARSPRVSAQEPPPDKQLIKRIAQDREIAEGEGPEAKCIRSLLFLLAGGLDHAHRIVQELSTTDAAYIHGMIHRLDDDFDNARYWFQRASMEAAAAEMYRRAAANSLTVASHPVWDPMLVTDMVETSRTNGVTDELRAVLKIEFDVLLQFLWEAIEPEGAA
jgi:hypothetical protein